MAPEVPLGHPTVLRAGNIWTWRYSHSDFPIADSWVYSASVVSTSSSTQAPLTWDEDYVTDDGAEWTIAIPVTVTETFAAGGYRLTAFTTLADARYSPYSAPLLVEADGASQATGAGLTHERKTWQAIKTLLEGRAVADIESYQIAGRALNRIAFADLVKYEAVYRNKVWRQENPGKAMPGYAVTFWPQS